MNPKRPLIFVPGIRTSRLAIRKENGSLEHFWPLMPHEFLIRAKLDRVFRYLEANIRLKADDDDDDNVKVVATSLIPFAYDGLIKSILTWGYKPNFDFWIFPYDWRQSNRISGHLLAKFIEEKTEGKCYDGDGVDIISHSMGGIIAQAASLNGAPIRRVAYIACPHLGSPLAYFILHPQIDSRRFIGSAYHDYPSSTYWQPNNDTGNNNNNNNNIERRKSLYQRRKELFVKFPSMYELLPDESYLRNRAILLTDGKPESGAEDTYLKNECAFKEKDMRSGVIKAMEFKKELGEELPQRQDVLLICGTNQMTCDTIHYRTSYQASITERRPSYLMQQGFSLPYDSGQGGDGYVPVTSAMALISGKPTYSNSVFIPEAHTVLSNSKATIEAIGRFLAA
ncbi:MAG: lipase/acyltransferase domain-containing protein [Nitrososphaeraceae archaeon]